MDKARRCRLHEGYDFLRMLGHERLAELLDGQVAFGRMTGGEFDRLGFDNVAQAGDEAMAASMEDTTRRRVGGARDLAAEGDAGLLFAVDTRHRREQCLRVRMVRPVEDLLGRAELHDPAQ